MVSGLWGFRDFIEDDDAAYNWGRSAPSASAGFECGTYTTTATTTMDGDAAAAGAHADAATAIPWSTTVRR